MSSHLRAQWRARARRGERVVYTAQVGTGGLFASLRTRGAATERRLYRGLSVEAPAGIARRYQQMVARGYPTEADLGAFSDFLAQALGQGLGTHWTTMPRVATSFATGGQGIPVLITAQAQGSELQDPAFWDEAEFQVEAGTSVEVTDVQVLDERGDSVMFVDPTGLPKTAYNLGILKGWARQFLQEHGPARHGICGVASWEFSDRFGHEMVSGRYQGTMHVWNRLPDGTIFDVTGGQFGGDPYEPVVVEPGEERHDGYREGFTS